MIGTYLYICYTDFKDKAIFISTFGIPESGDNIYFQAIFTYINSEEALENGRLAVAGLRIKLNEPDPFVFSQGNYSLDRDDLVNALWNSDGTPAGAAKYLKKNRRYISHCLQNYRINWKQIYEARQKQLIKEALETTDYQVVKAANLLNIHFRTLKKRMNELDITIPERQKTDRVQQYITGIDCMN